MRRTGDIGSFVITSEGSVAAGVRGLEALTGRGATAYLAGMHRDVYPGLQGFAATWARERRFEPAMSPTLRDHRYAGWRAAVKRTLSR